MSKQAPINHLFNANRKMQQKQQNASDKTIYTIGRKEKLQKDRHNAQ